MMRFFIPVFILLFWGCSKTPVDIFIGKYSCTDTVISFISAPMVGTDIDTNAAFRYIIVKKTSDKSYQLLDSDSTFVSERNMIPVYADSSSFFTDTINPFTLKGTITDSTMNYSEFPMISHTYTIFHKCNCIKLRR